MNPFKGLKNLWHKIIGSGSLNLPLEYRKYPEYFDAFNINEGTRKKNAVIADVLKTHNVKTVLDLTCGTGSQVFFLSKRGYTCTGADFSPALLKMARGKSLREGLPIQWIDGDMRTLKVGTFDAVITIFNAVGHLTPKDFEVALKNIHANLTKGGLYVFDIFNLAAMTNDKVKNLSMHVQKQVHDTVIHHMQCSTLNKKKGLLTSYDYYALQKNADKPNFMKHSFSLQLYTPQQLRDMLHRQGFEIINQCNLDGSDFLQETTLSMLTVARKISI